MINFNSKIYSKYSLLIILLSLIAYSNSLHSQWIQVHSLSKGYVNTFAYSNNSLTLLNVSDNNNQILTISFKISTNEYVLLRVFNELGNCIETLASEELSPGEYQRYLDMSQKPNGVYFIFLQAGSRIDNKKFLLFR